jgi:hypothetical protein
MSITGALVSLLRGKRYYYEEPETPPPPAMPAATVPAGSGDPRTPARRDGGPAPGA